MVTPAPMVTLALPVFTLPEPRPSETVIEEMCVPAVGSSLTVTLVPTANDDRDEQLPPGAEPALIENAEPPLIRKLKASPRRSGLPAILQTFSWPLSRPLVK